MQASVSLKKFCMLASPLLLVIFIDSMGLGLVFPLLNTLIMDPQHSILAANTSINMRNFIFGLIISAFMLCWFFGAAFLGDLSDQIGRKKSLMICLVGTLFGYLLSAFGVEIGSLTCLILGRITAGLTAGSQAIAQAAIIDISLEQDKARNIGLILCASSVGFVAGPIIGGFLSNNHVLPWFNFSMPFYFAACISLTNTFLLQILFKENFTRTEKLQLNYYHAINIFLSAFKHEKIKNLAYIFLIMIVGWSSFYSFIAMFLLKRFNFTPITVSYYMGLMGAGFGLGSGFFVNFFTKHFAAKNIVVYGLIITALCAAIVAFTKISFYAWLAIVPLCIAISVAYSVLVAIFSNQVGPTHQGWIMGITGAIMAMAFGMSSLLVGLLAGISVELPLMISTATLVISATLMLILHKENNTATQVDTVVL